MGEEEEERGSRRPISVFSYVVEGFSICKGTKRGFLR